MKSPLPELRIRARPSRLHDLLLMMPVLAAAAGLGLPGLPYAMRIALALLVILLVLWAKRDEMTAGIGELYFDARDGLALSDRDGREFRVRFHGHAQLGTLAVLLYVSRAGRPPGFGRERITIWRDAVDAEDFRRLRARLRFPG